MNISREDQPPMKLPRTPEFAGWRAARTGLLVWLVLGGQLLSFDALRTFALRAHIIHGGLGPLNEHDLAGVFALIIDALVWVGILGVKLGGKEDWKAWGAMAVGLLFTLGFQVFLPGEQITLAGTAGRAVPPLALAVGIVVLEVQRAHASTSDVVELAKTGKPTGEAVLEAPTRESRPTPRRTTTRRDDPDVRARVAELIGQKRTRPEIHAETGASFRLIDTTRKELNGSVT
jgi:hypothetical protein